MDRAPTSITPNTEQALTRRRAELDQLEDSLTEAHWQTREEKRNVVPNGQSSSTEQQKTMVSLLRHQVLLLAMKNGRAPLPISPALWKGLHRQGFLNDVYDLGSLARRLLFLGDGRILLAELRVQAAAKPTAEEKTSKEMENAKESRPQFEEER